MSKDKAYQLSRFMVASVGIALLFGCQLPADKRSLLGEMEKTLQEGSDSNVAIRKNATSNLPGEVKSAFLPTLPEAQGNSRVASEKRFDLVAEDVVAKNFFLSLVEGTPYNMTVHPGVDGKISLQLKKVTVKEVLETVRNIYGFDFRQTAQGIEILPASLQTRAFAVHYLDIKRGGSSEIQVSGSSLKGSNSGQSSNSSSGTGTTTGTSSSSSNGSSGASTNTIINSQITTTANTDFWTELKLAIETIVGKADGRTVAVSPLSSLVVVQAMPDELKKVEDFLKSADLCLNKQVILEAKILEVNLNDSFQAGINWALVSGRFHATQNGGSTIKSAPTVDGIFPTLNSDNTTSQSISPAPSPAVNTAKSVAPFGGVFALSTNFENLGTFIELLSAQGKVNVLSSPRVSTLNNQPALIKVGFDQFFVTNVSTTTAATAGTTTASTTPNITFDSFFSGISLDVTPHITDANEVTLHIHPTISDVVTDTIKIDLGTTAGGPVQYPLAKSSVRESDSMVRAKNRELIVLGGLMQNENAGLEQGIPFFKDLPGIGRFFKHTVQVSQKKELVILLRPIIVNDGTSTEDVDNSLDRFHQLNDEVLRDQTRWDHLLK